MKPIYGHMVTEPVAQCHIRYRIYGVPRIRRIYGQTVWANPNYNVLEAGGQFVVVGGWLVQAQSTPQNSINTFLYYTRIAY